MPLRYPVSYFVFNFTTMVSIYYADGTVAVSSGGVEMGQGMNTRVSLRSIVIILLFYRVLHAQPRLRIL